jgi:hypothetical protein
MVPFCWLFTGIDGSRLLPHFCMSTVDGAVWWDVGDGDVADGAVGSTDEMVIGWIFDNELKCLV